MKKPHFRIIFSQNEIRQAEKKKKNNLDPNFAHTRPGEENSEKDSKKIQKTTFRHYFQPKRDEIGYEIENKILVPNSVHNCPEQENSKKNRKKNQKIKKPLSGIIFSQNGMRQAEKEKKILVSNSVHT